MSVFRRYKFFLVAALIVAVLSLIMLLRYSTISKINVKLSGSAELGLKYLHDLKGKLSHETESGKDKNKYITSIRQTGKEKPIATDDSVDELVKSSLKKNSEEKQNVVIALTTENTKSLLQTRTEKSIETIQTTAMIQPNTEPSKSQATMSAPTTAQQEEEESNSDSKNNDLERCPSKPPDLGE